MSFTQKCLYYGDLKLIKSLAFLFNVPVYGLPKQRVAPHDYDIGYDGDSDDDYDENGIYWHSLRNAAPASRHIACLR